MIRRPSTRRWPRPSAPRTGPRPARAIDRRHRPIGRSSVSATAAVVVVLDNCEHVLDAAAADRGPSCSPDVPALRIVATSREPLGLDGRAPVRGGIAHRRRRRGAVRRAGRAVQPGVRAPTEPTSSSCAGTSTGCRSPSSSPPPGPRRCRCPRSRHGSSDRFEPARRSRGGRRPTANAPCGPPSTGATTCSSTTNSGRSAGSRCSPAASRATPRRTCAAPMRSTSSPGSSTSHCSSPRRDGATARFHMLESLRAYGLDRLAEAGERDAASRDHGRWCIGLAESAEAGIRTFDQLAWLDRLDVEHDNLAAALALGGSRRRRTPGCGSSARSSCRGGSAAAAEMLGTGSRPSLASATGPLPRCWPRCSRGAGCSPTSAKARGGRAASSDELDLADRRQRAAAAIGLELGDELVVAYARSQRSLTLTRRALAGFAVDRAEIAALDRVPRSRRSTSIGDHFGAGQTRIMQAVGLLSVGRRDGCARRGPVSP